MFKKVIRNSFLIFGILLSIVVYAAPGKLYILDDVATVIPPHANQIKAHRVTLNPGVLRKTNFTIDLFGDEVLVVRSRLENHQNGDFVWVGVMDSNPNSEVVFAQHKGKVSGFVRYVEAGIETTIELTNNRNNNAVLYAVNPNALPEIEPPTLPDAASSGLGKKKGTLHQQDLNQAPTIQKLLVAFTPSACAARGSCDNLETDILATIASTNQAYINSGLNLRIELAHLETVDYVESGMVSSLKQLTRLAGHVDDPNGELDGLHALRTLYEADLVSLISDDTTYCGVGWINADADTAFNVVNWQCLSNHSLAHELGHNQGNAHNRLHARAQGAYEYSYGYRVCEAETGFRTIMSYVADCDVPRVNHLSNPLVDYNGVATGIAYADNPQTAADNVSSMVNTAQLVAGFMQSDAERLELGTPATQTHLPGDTVTLSLQASSAAGRGLHFSANNLPEGILVDEATGFISGVISANAFDEQTVTVYVSDGNVEVAAEFTWLVTGGVEVGSGGGATAVADVCVQSPLLFIYYADYTIGYPNPNCVLTINPPVALSISPASNNHDGNYTLDWAWDENQPPEDFDHLLIYESTAPSQLGTVVATISDSAITSQAFSKGAITADYYYHVQVCDVNQECGEMFPAEAAAGVAANITVVSIDQFYATNSTINERGQLELHRSVSHAENCQLSVDLPQGWSLPGGNLISNPTILTALSVEIQTSYQFTLSCNDGVNNTSQLVNVTVNDIDVKINSLTASLSNVEINNTSTLSWDVSNGSLCTASNGTGGWAGTAITLPTGSKTISFPTPGTFGFDLQCTDAVGGSDTRSVTITATVPVLPGNPENPPSAGSQPNMSASASSSAVGVTAGQFRVDESGSATYSIPILTVPGSGGVAPQMSLNYSSQSGNGPLGVGWSLGGVSAITRCAQTLEQDTNLTSRGVTFTSEDRFCLDGQRLLLVSGTYGANNAEYRTEIDSIARIKSYGTAGTGPQRFIVERKDGSVNDYGNTSDSRIEARIPGDSSTVFVWAQNRFEDSAQNYINYKYKELEAPEPVEFVLKSVDTLTIQLTFVYLPRNTSLTQSYSAGATFGQSQRLESVLSQGKNQNNTWADVRFYDLQYTEYAFGREMLTSIQECSSVGKTTCFPATTFAWQSTENNIGSALVPDTTLLPTTPYGMQLADVNGDGRPDLLYTEKETSPLKFYLKVKTANEDGTFSIWGNASGYLLPEKQNDNLPEGLLVIDVNADGYQDVIFLEYDAVAEDHSWKVMVSNGVGFAAKAPLNNKHFGESEPRGGEQVLDFDGDGLSDLLQVQQGSVPNSPSVLIVHKNLYSAANGNAINFAEPVTVTIDYKTLFADEDILSNMEIYDHIALSDLSGPSGRAVYDYNGDGAVDILVKASRIYEVCVSPCSIFDPLVEGDLPEGLSRTTASFWIILEANSSETQGVWSYNYTFKDIIAKATNCNEDLDVCNMSTAPVANDVWPVDINADGLADIAYLHSIDSQGNPDGKTLSYRLNLGDGLSTSVLPLYTLPFVDMESHVRFDDWNGDGYPDLLYPSSLDSQSAKWMVLENDFGLGFPGGAVDSTKPAGNVTVHHDTSLFVDFTGDGKRDHLFFDYKAPVNGGTFIDATMRIGTVSNQANHVITSIINGLGAVTNINYLPLTNAAVYTRMQDSANANWGKGSVVYDMIAPMYVVSQASSSAPVYGNANALSSVEYHYVGAKMQAGGRGFLGFGEVISYDPQSGIRTNTRYRQDFPFIGMPADTAQALVSVGNEFKSISDTNSSTPVDWSQTPAWHFTQPPSVNGTSLSYAINEWAIKATAGGAVFPYIADSLERSYTLSGAFDRKVYTSANVYDSYGNLTSSKVRTYSTDVGTVDTEFAEQLTINIYTNSTSNWHLGRLSSSTVQHERNNSVASRISRHSSFLYDAATGILKQETIEPGTQFQVVTSYGLDGKGNRISTSVTGSGMSARTGSVSYDPLGRFVIQSRNGLNQVTQNISSWDVFGNPLSATNIDGIQTIGAADLMGRPFISYTQTGGWSKTLNTQGTVSTCPSGTVFYTTTTGGGKPIQIQCFDKLGRGIRTAVQSLNGSYVYTDQYSDNMGRPERASVPYFAGGAIYWNQSGYDVLGRVIVNQNADNSGSSSYYDNQLTSNCTNETVRVVRTNNELNQNRVELKNALGETETIYDHNCGIVSYQYDAIGNLTQVQGADGAVVTMNYDLAGRKISMNDPDKGYWQYRYNALGEMTRQLDTKNQAIDFYYDTLGRVTDRYELTGVASLCDTTYTTVNRETTTYRSTSPGKSQLASVIYRSGSAGTILQQKAIVYDGYGRLSTLTTGIDGNNYTETTTYDNYGRVFQQFDVTGGDRGIRNVYNTRGYLSQIKEAREGALGQVYQTINAMDAFGNTTQMTLGNGVTAYATYDIKNGRLENLTAYKSNGAELQDVDYIFDVLGNLNARHDQSGSTNLKETFGYDTLNRLKTVNLTINGVSAGQTLALNYGASGNITTKSDVGSYLYNSGKPHAVSNAGGISYTYDSNGNNTASGDGRTIGYTVFDKASLITKGTTQVEFKYGIGNSRYQRIDYQSLMPQITTTYLGNVELIDDIADQGTTGAYFKRYLGGVAIINFYPTTQTDYVQYLLKDHIGSIHTVMDENGDKLAGMHFGAFGQRQGGATEFDNDWQLNLAGSSSLAELLNAITTRGFTGHEMVDTVGIIHMNGRIYDPKLGRFLQADPHVQAPKNSQSLNRYSYVFNNPLSYTDPSGYFSIGGFIKKYWRTIAAIVVSFYLGPAAYAYFGILSGSATVGAIAGGALTGAVAGGIATGTLRGAFAGAVTGALFGALHSVASGVGKTLAHGAVGGVGSELNGGKFGHGFLSAGFTQALGSVKGFFTEAPRGIERIGNAIKAAVVGGTASVLSGGKFANGAVTGAFSRALNDDVFNFESLDDKSLLDVKSPEGEFGINILDQRVIGYNGRFLGPQMSLGPVSVNADELSLSTPGPIAMGVDSNGEFRIELTVSSHGNSGVYIKSSVAIDSPKVHAVLKNVAKATTPIIDPNTNSMRVYLLEKLFPRPIELEK